MDHGPQPSLGVIPTFLTDVQEAVEGHHFSIPYWGSQPWSFSPFDGAPAPPEHSRQPASPFSLVPGLGETGPQGEREDIFSSRQELSPPSWSSLFVFSIFITLLWSPAKQKVIDCHSSLSWWCHAAFSSRGHQSFSTGSYPQALLSWEFNPCLLSSSILWEAVELDPCFVVWNTCSLGQPPPSESWEGPGYSFLAFSHFK